MGLSAWVEGILANPEMRARAFHWLWLASLGMLALGYLVIVQHYWGRPALAP